MTKIYEAQNHILIRTGYSDPVEHSHIAAHIIISMGDETSVVINGETHLCSGIIIPSGTSHVVDTNKNDVLVFLYDATTAVAKQIEEIQYIPKVHCKHITERYNMLEQRYSAELYENFIHNVLKLSGHYRFASDISDERIIFAMEIIHKSLTKEISCEKVAHAVNLSQSRFSRLFKEQVGMTFSAYLIYQRIMHAYSEIISGKSITDAALDAGFSSSSHFADVNRRVFGISASNITHNMVFIKVR